MQQKIDRVEQFIELAALASANSHQESAEMNLRYQADTDCQSPIEQLLKVALLAVREINFLEIAAPAAFSQLANGAWVPACGLHIQQQVPIDRYKADFLIFWVGCPLEDGSKAEHYRTSQKIVIECDGHAFHERTPAQAAHDKKRDRKMQSLGYKVYRFTGREIHADPFACAIECIQETVGWELTDPRSYLPDGLK